MSNEGFVEYTPEGRPPRSWDFFLTIFLLLLLLILTGVFVIVLTNRVHPTRENNQIREARQQLADAVMRGLQ